jgi:hypothetical protein
MTREISMADRRLALTVLLLVATIGLTGCRPSDDQDVAEASTGPSASASPSPADDPATDLADAAARLSADTLRVRVAVSGQMSMTGVLDPRAQAGVVKVDMGPVDDGAQAEVRTIGADMWIKLRGPVPSMLGGTGDWMHLAAADLPAESSFNILPAGDPAGIRAMIAAMTGVRRAGPHGFAGTIDLSRSPKYSAATLKSLGAKASFVPFTATTDAQGRLITLTVDLTPIASGAGQLTTHFSDFGVPVEVERPPADATTEVPDELKSVIDA